MTQRTLLAAALAIAFALPAAAADTPKAEKRTPRADIHEFSFNFDYDLDMPALLADWGLPVSPDRADEPVRAELLYSPDGEALAVRLIH